MNVRNTSDRTLSTGGASCLPGKVADFDDASALAIVEAGLGEFTDDNFVIEEEVEPPKRVGAISTYGKVKPNEPEPS